MSYTARKNYKTRREINRKIFKNLRIILIFLLIALVVYAVKNRVSILNYLSTYFY
jgi:hypothetical protein